MKMLRVMPIEGKKGEGKMYRILDAIGFGKGELNNRPINQVEFNKFKEEGVNIIVRDLPSVYH